MLGFSPTWYLFPQQLQFPGLPKDGEAVDYTIANNRECQDFFPAHFKLPLIPLII